MTISFHDVTGRTVSLPPVFLLYGALCLLTFLCPLLLCCDQTAKCYHSGLLNEALSRIAIIKVCVGEGMQA